MTYTRLAVFVFSMLAVAGCSNVSPNQPMPDAFVWHDAALSECEQGQTTCIDNNFYRCVLGEWSLARICTTLCDPQDGCQGSQSGDLSFIWVANTGESTLSKIDTREEVEVARYRTCPDVHCDPSRTSVNLHGDAVVTNRNVSPSSSLTKFAANIDDCVDRNNDGVIQTSTGPTDVLAWGVDECMIWHTVLPEVGGGLGPGGDMHGARATAWDGQEDQDTGEGGHVWVGTCSWEHDNCVYKINGDTGEIDDYVVIPELSCAYGGAVDGLGNFWIIVTGDSQVPPSLWQIEMDGMWHTQRTVSCGYGITVDSQNRVWSGGGMGMPCVSRYNSVTDQEDVAQISGATFPRGIAAGVAKSAGYVWQVDNGVLFKIDEETMATEASYPIAGDDTIGVAVDFEGYVWVVSRGSSQVYKFDPDTETYITIDVGMEPYTYSDMTGVQLRSVIIVD